MASISNIPQFLKDHRWTVDKTTREKPPTVKNPTTELWLSDSEHDTVILSQVVKGIGNVDLNVTYHQANPEATEVVNNVHGRDAYNLSTAAAGADQKQHAKDINAMDMGMMLVGLRQKAQAGGA